MRKFLRVGLASDIHLEHERRPVSVLVHDAVPGNRPRQGPDLSGTHAAKPDLFLLAGDIASGLETIAYADSVARYLACPVLVVAGNHEAYGFDLITLLPQLRAAAATTDGRVRFLERDRADFEVKGRHIAVLGATMWTDYDLLGDVSAGMLCAERSINDHRRIRYGNRKFLPKDALEIHSATRKWLALEVPCARREADVLIVMTHHAPIDGASAPEFRSDELAPAFGSDLRREIETWKPDLWVWGHTHWSVRTQIGGTILASAQRGYIGQERGADKFVPTIIDL